MITASTLADNTRLTTVAAVREQFGITTGDLNDAGVEAVIDRASAMAVAYCGRNFARETVTQLDFSERPTSRIVLERAPVVADGLVVTEDATTLTVTTDYILLADRPILLRMKSGKPYCWACGPIETAYSAGWLLPEDDGRDLPADIEQAVILLCGDIWQVIESGESGIKKRETAVDVATVEWWQPSTSAALSNPVSEMILSRYRKVAF